MLTLKLNEKDIWSLVDWVQSMENKSKIVSH
jgi:hypothetical protein